MSREFNKQLSVELSRKMIDNLQAFIYDEDNPYDHPYDLDEFDKEVWMKDCIEASFITNEYLWNGS